MLFRTKVLDAYVIKYPTGSHIPPHKDTVKAGRHFRLNVILKEAEGGEFKCPEVLIGSRRMKLFRPDLHTHEVTKVTRGTRWVFSLGWVLP